VDRLYTLLDHYHAGDIASVLGLLVSVVGFLFTIYGVWRSKRSAQRAEAAAQRASGAIASMHSISDLAAVLAALDEVKRLQRSAAWDLLPDRYSSLRGKLITLRTSRPYLTEDQHATLQGAIQHLADLEKTVVRALTSSKTPSKISRLNSIVSDQIDRLTELLAQLHREEVDHG